jgi:hypothetical protein
MVWCVVAEAQVVQRLVSQTISCSFTRTVSPHAPSLRRKVEKDFIHQQIGAEEGRGSQPNRSFAIVPNDLMKGTEAPTPPPGLCTNRYAR